jgi:WS/DGAT/MGAT family acyltransferase
MHGGGVLVFDAGPLATPEGGVDFERIQRHVEAALPRLPRYRQRVVRAPLLDEPVWIDDARFNLDYHVRHTALPRPGDERQLKRLAARIFSQELDRAKPLWELWVVEGLEGGRFAFVLKVHHCMVDGVSGADLVVAMLTSDAHGAHVHWRPRPAPDGLGLAARTLAHHAAAPLAFARGVGDLLRRPARAAALLRKGAEGLLDLARAGVTPASDTPLNGPIGPHRRFDWLALRLDDVKRIKNTLGGTVNDVALCLVAGAVGEWLRARDVGVAALDFRALVPMSLRAGTEHHTVGNRVASLVARLPVAERDPVKRLRAVHETTSKLKHSHQALGSEIVEDLSDWVSNALLVEIARVAARQRAYNIVVTNVPGSPVPIELLGARLRAVHPLVPLFGDQAFGVALFSYAGGLFFGLNADRDAVPDLHELALGIEREMESLLAACSSVAHAKKPEAARRRRRSAAPSRDDAAAAGEARELSRGRSAWPRS